MNPPVVFENSKAVAWTTIKLSVIPDAWRYHSDNPFDFMRGRRDEEALMPVLREDQEKRAETRGRRWLWLLAVPPTILLLGLGLGLAVLWHAPTSVPVGSWLITGPGYRGGGDPRIVIKLVKEWGPFTVDEVVAPTPSRPHSSR